MEAFLAGRRITMSSYDIKNTETDYDLAESLAILTDQKDIMSMIQDYELKKMSATEEEAFFKYLFDSALVWTMPNSYIKRVEDFLDRKIIYFN